MALLYVNIAFLAGMHRPCWQIEIHRHYIIPNAMLISKASYRSSSWARFPLSPYFSERTEAFSAYWQPWKAEMWNFFLLLASELNERPHSAISGGSMALPAGLLHSNSEAAPCLGLVVVLIKTYGLWIATWNPHFVFCFVCFSIRIPWQQWESNASSWRNV